MRRLQQHSARHRERPRALSPRRKAIEGARPMTVCTYLSDRMPDVALGRARWTVEDERHLAACADCDAEWAIVSVARGRVPGATTAGAQSHPAAAARPHGKSSASAAARPTSAATRRARAGRGLARGGCARSRGRPRGRDRPPAASRPDGSRRRRRPTRRGSRPGGQVTLVLHRPSGAAERHVRHPIGQLRAHGHRTSSFNRFTAWW